MQKLLDTASPPHEGGHRFRTQLKQRREEIGKTQADIAKLVGYNSPEIIGMAEAGSRKFDLNRMPRVASALELNPVNLSKAALEEMHPLLYQTLFGDEVPNAIKKAKIGGISVAITPDMADVVIKIFSMDKAARTTILKLIDIMYNSNCRSPR